MRKQLKKDAKDVKKARILSRRVLNKKATRSAQPPCSDALNKFEMLTLIALMLQRAYGRRSADATENDKAIVQEFLAVFEVKSLNEMRYEQFDAAVAWLRKEKTTSAAEAA